MTPPGFNANVVPRGDDTSNLVVNMPFPMNWNGTHFTQVYINMNGNVTFGDGFTAWNPSTTLAGTGRNIMAPFWADVDTRNTAASQVTFSSIVPGSIPQVGGRNAFIVNWINVARFDNQSTPTNSFQLVLVDRSDTGVGNFDFIFNYDQITWDIATRASTVRARAGWGFSGTGFELPGSGIGSGSPSALLDTSSPATSLIQNMMNAEGQLGRYVFQVRAGQAPNIPPQLSVVDRTLEGNASGGFSGYAGTGDATAIDPDGSIVSLTHDRPGFLPLGVTHVTWTATDNRGAVTTATQRITVVDTTPPSNPTLTSPTHTPHVWSTVSSVTAQALGGADVCSGVNAFSYSWSRGAAESPDAVPDPTTQLPGAPPQEVVVHDQSFPTTTWPPEWIRSSTWVRLTTVAARTRGTSAAEVWTDENGARRTANFFRDFDLREYSDATLRYWDFTTGLEGADVATVDFSLDGGATWTTLRSTGANAGWTQRTFTLPVGDVVRIRFGGSVNRVDEFCNWDDIRVTGTTFPGQPTFSATSTVALGDGRWFFNLRTVDNAGNWSAPVNMGPFLVDTTAPVTTDDAPSGWVSGPVVVALTASDLGQIAFTRYSVDSVVWHTYSAPITIAVQGTTTLRYYSGDAAGHVEQQRSAIVRIDSIPPTAPTGVSASALSTQSVEVTWAPASDAVSGVVAYRVYRDDVLVASTTELRFTEAGLTPGQTYRYRIVAVDAAGNATSSASVEVTLPIAGLWLTVSNPVVEMGALDPGVRSTVTSATVVSVGGVGEVTYELMTAAADFANTNAASATPSMPVGFLTFVTRGWTDVAERAFSLLPQVVNSSTGTPYVWQHDYTFDLSMTVPIEYAPGTYTTVITYTLVER